jgi:glucose-1-phosphate thymidylyltransferase
MKGVILAGGLGTRLFPLTRATNKHLLPVYDRCMVQYPIETLLRAGIKDLMIVTGGPHAGHFLPVLGNGKKLGIPHLEYAYQEGEGGIADALRLCEDFADGGPLFVALGDNITNADFSKEVKNFKGGAHIFLAKVKNPQAYGVVEFDARSRRHIRALHEKPRRPPSQFVVTGFYIYDETVFDFIRRLKPSARGELEITDVNNHYLGEGRLAYSKIKGFWCDAGENHDFLLHAGQTIARLRKAEDGA